ncbi:hypothetical protein DFJ73DRAFT_810558 [Zopfochytrium polystomum]|nr:hypothetical protein DFJ73DRAFT_810558 [Zopfochytrium polystomum]
MAQTLLPAATAARCLQTIASSRCHAATSVRVAASLHWFHSASPAAAAFVRRPASSADPTTQRLLDASDPVLHRYNTRSLRPQVYKKMHRKLLKEDVTKEASNLPKDAVQALTVAQELIKKGALKRVGWTGNRKELFMERLRADGGDKIVTFSQNILHVDYTRFVSVLTDIRGLSLNDALLQLKWQRKKISLKMEQVLANAIVKAKDEGLDLSKTYVADCFVERNGAVLSQEFVRRFIRGRGRYGATPHPVSSLVEVTLQERERPFDRRLADPLEWIRNRLRSRVRDQTPSPEEVYRKTKRQEKQIYS